MIRTHTLTFTSNYNVSKIREKMNKSLCSFLIKQCATRNPMQILIWPWIDQQNVVTLKELLLMHMGSFVDVNKVGQVFTDRASTTWYTIEAQGRVGNASRRIRAVFQAREGQFYYVRME